LPWLGSEEEVKVVGHQTVAKQPEWVTLVGGRKGLKEGEMVVVIRKDAGPVVAAVKGMINEAVVDGAR
jgi:hypothetical protein